MFIFWLSACFSSSVFSYELFIGHGYTSCKTCHYNPYGNGPLNDYGRAVSASVVSSNQFYKEGVSDEYLANRSGFLFSPSSTSWVRPSVNVRYLKKEKTKWILMQANMNLVFKFGKDDRFIASGSLGYAPKKESGDDEYRSREHYLGYRIDDSLWLYGGLMDKIFGLRLENHSAFKQQITANTMNDQSHGVLVHYIKDSFDIGLSYIFGNQADKEKETRQQGFVTRLDYIVNNFLKYGLSWSSTESEVTKNSMYAFHFKKGLDKGSSILFEIGQVDKDIKTTKSKLQSKYAYLQNTIRFSRGVYGYMQYEYLNADTSTDDYIVRFGPGLQYFPGQRVELRLDLIEDRSFNSDSYLSSSTFLAQLHLWF